MKRRVGLALIVTAFASSLACQSPNVTGLTPSDEAAIRKVIHVEMQAANATDAASWAALYIEDAIVLPPHGPALEGRDAIQRWLATLPPVSNAKGVDLEVQGSGDLAYLRGSYTMTFTVPGVPTPITDVGTFVQIHRRQVDGSWKVSREIYNSDLPLPSPAPPAQ